MCALKQFTKIECTCLELLAAREIKFYESLIVKNYSVTNILNDIRQMMMMMVIII